MPQEDIPGQCIINLIIYQSICEYSNILYRYGIDLINIIFRTFSFRNFFYVKNYLYMFMDSFIID